MPTTGAADDGSANVIAERVRDVRKRMEAAKARRPAALRHLDVQLVAATKGASARQVREAVEAGVEAVGESRVQEMIRKFHPPEAEWRPTIPLHFIGPLQRNKVKVAMEWCELIQSVDSLPLAEAIHRRRVADPAGSAAAAPQRVLVQVNLAGELSKGGFAPAELRPALEQMSHWSGLAVEGLMAIPPQTSDVESARPYFRQLRQLANQAAGWAIPGVAMTTVSMGMTHDFEIAIEEGATMIRVGTALFGTRQPAGLHTRAGSVL